MSKPSILRIINPQESWVMSPSELLAKRASGIPVVQVIVVYIDDLKYGGQERHNISMPQSSHASPHRYFFSARDNCLPGSETYPLDPEASRTPKLSSRNLVPVEFDERDARVGSNMLFGKHCVTGLDPTGREDSTKTSPSALWQYTIRDGWLHFCQESPDPCIRTALDDDDEECSQGVPGSPKKELAVAGRRIIQGPENVTRQVP
ncbi:hypothetical protein AUEXF2481DRAFT_29420 [Aureobasidium subglaciale EXF-2481]|uniref:Uncharacterized protein n=1 Tax=Aureobasidium subglaciale (strain EXF-2481) TaxID=1043005 RepID=A0A074Z926_AURSE|nr:uncharacterized protein AUEXF2481DRAFT_29420 [Aureobasidium subglaciale EXF-2481]KEQ95336.1 hypothetical protein AUEXF2481DRAFT_29420 [Aureobasidium subglaciale EXF-2481]